MPLIEETSHLLILDCVNAEKSPGTLVELTKDQIPLYHGIKMSMHQITFQEILGLADIRKFLPQYLHLVGVQPMSLVIGSELSQQVQDQLPHVILQAEAMLQQWLDDEPSV
jgi:hydrogenase maturation protease